MAYPRPLLRGPLPAGCQGKQSFQSTVGKVFPPRQGICKMNSNEPDSHPALIVLVLSLIVLTFACAPIALLLIARGL